MNSRPAATIDRAGVTAKLIRLAFVTGVFGAIFALSTAHAQCTTRSLGGGFVSYSCADGRSGTTVVPGGAGANQGPSAPHLPPTNSGVGISKELFGNRSGISQRVGPDRSIHLYGGRTGSSVGRGGGITTHTGPAFQPEPADPPVAAPSAVPNSTPAPDAGQTRRRQRRR